MNFYSTLYSYQRMLECWGNRLEERPTFSELQEYFVRLYNEKLRCYENCKYFKNLLPAFRETHTSCVNALYTMPDGILEQPKEVTTTAV
jgi:hypothetical protein